MKKFEKYESSFKIEPNKADFVRIGKIEENLSKSNSIYIHRYQNPLINARKKISKKKKQTKKKLNAF